MQHKKKLSAHCLIFAVYILENDLYEYSVLAEQSLCIALKMLSP